MENASTIIAVLQIAARAVVAIREVFTMVAVVAAAFRFNRIVGRSLSCSTWSSFTKKWTEMR